MISKYSIQACYLHPVGAVVVIVEPLGIVVPEPPEPPAPPAPGSRHAQT